MNPEAMLLVLTRNGADIKLIVEKIGLQNLLDLAPHFMAIYKTLQTGKV